MHGAVLAMDGSVAVAVLHALAHFFAQICPPLLGVITALLITITFARLVSGHVAHLEACLVTLLVLFPVDLTEGAIALAARDDFVFIGSHVGSLVAVLIALRAAYLLTFGETLVV